MTSSQFILEVRKDKATIKSFNDRQWGMILSMIRSFEKINSKDTISKDELRSYIDEHEIIIEKRDVKPFKVLLPEHLRKHFNL